MAIARNDKIDALALAVVGATDNLSLTAYFPVPETLRVTEVESLESIETPVVVARPAESILTPS